jgi:hypothetical protein
MNLYTSILFVVTYEEKKVSAGGSSQTKLQWT